MTDYNINPFGSSAVMPEGYPIADDLSTDSAQQSLSAKQGMKLRDMIGGAAGGTWLALGTSITWYNDHVSSAFTKGYQTRVMERITFSSMNNQGVNGGCIAGSGGLAANANSIIVSADYVTVEHGINDWGNGRAVGTMADFTGNTGNNTFYGAYRTVIDTIYSKNANAKIILITPRKGYGFNGFLPDHWYDAKNGVYLKDYADAVLEIAKYMSLPVCDWFNECNCNQSNLAGNSIDTALHPNDKGYQKMADVLVEAFRKVIP